MWLDNITKSLNKCPFLHAVKEQEGYVKATEVAELALGVARCDRKMRPAGAVNDFRKAFLVVHGPDGFTPLDVAAYQPTASTCGWVDVPPHAQEDAKSMWIDVQNPPLFLLNKLDSCGSSYGSSERSRPACSLPFASIALTSSFLVCIIFTPSFIPMPNHTEVFVFISLFKIYFEGDWFKNSRRRKRRSKRNSGASDAAAGQSQTGAPDCVKPIAALVISKAGHLQCPPAIVAFRKAVAQTPLCRALRPHSVPYKLAASGLVSYLVNLGPGAVKEHFDKYSPGWFVAIHLSIPFVAALRKAIVLPPYALVITVTGAIAGQVIGGRLERARLMANKSRKVEGPVDVQLAFASVLSKLQQPWT